MKVEILPQALLLSFILLCSFLKLIAQEHKYFSPASSTVLLANSANIQETYAYIFVYYPLVKSGENFSVFINRKNIAKLVNGGRLECRLLIEGPVAITIIEGSSYREPLTQSKNSRTITINKGKSYYFRVGGTGELEYIFAPGKGQKYFTEDKEFISQPNAFVETAGNPIPTLGTRSN